MKTDLERGFDDLLGHGDRQGRGYQFQKWLRDLLLLAGFEVHSNPQMAKPRQTDIHARRASRDFLIEAKWRQAEIDVSDIDALRSRLDRTASDVVGCLFSLSDYSATAITAVEERRTREILLFSAAEIQDLARSPSALSGLIEDKRASLRVHARVKWLHPEGNAARPAETQLPPSELQLWCNGCATNCVASGTDNVDIVFSQEHLDPIGCADDPEFALRLDLDIRYLPELREVLGTLHNYLGLSARGTFAIHQTEVCWHGTGAEKFLAAASAWQSRYRDTALHTLHHSEELYYVDEFSYGRLVVTARQRVGESVFLHGAEAEIRLAGIPVDREPLLELCRKTGNRDAFLRVDEKCFDQLQFRSERIIIEPIGMILSSKFTEERIVSGVIARNPFFHKLHALTKAGLKPRSPIEYLSTSEILCCSLNDWHDAGDVIGEYCLASIQSKWLGQALIIRPTCTWKTIMNRRQPPLARARATKAGVAPGRRTKAGPKETILPQRFDSR